MKKKRVYLLTIAYIAVYAMLTKLTYPELEITALTTVIAVLGFVSALATNYLIKKVECKIGKNND
ncbi:hypothetical protein [Candidatus Thiosymbion oneisti]|uniref:hypothetical protein n=1 Tax=Candidatus Thiosymbion oneisti TaxID=589554 RepID=UPI000B7C6E59|nr:hypothetical protein [Candidatus Thiosymbion oneisti]